MFSCFHNTQMNQWTHDRTYLYLPKKLENTYLVALCSPWRWGPDRHTPSAWLSSPNLSGAHGADASQIAAASSSERKFFWPFWRPFIWKQPLVKDNTLGFVVDQISRGFSLPGLTPLRSQTVQPCPCSSANHKEEALAQGDRQGPRVKGG